MTAMLERISGARAAEMEAPATESDHGVRRRLLARNGVVRSGLRSEPI